MHLFQGTLDFSTTLITSAAGLMTFGAACLGARRELRAKQLPALLAMTSFVFTAQMVNCSTGFGFSGHLLGAGLLAILFGPWSAMLSMGLVLTVQATFLGDGSLSTLGANFLNMGVVAPCVAYAVFRLLQGRRSPQLDVAQCTALALASLLSTLVAAISLGVLSGLPMSAVLPPFLAIGLIEAIFSVGVFAICVRGLEAATSQARHYMLRPIVAVCVLALCFIPLSSKQPDGLEFALSTAVPATK